MAKHRLSPHALLASLALAYPVLTGFVLLSAHEAQLPVSPIAPVMTFTWDGESPSIKGKDKYKDGAYQDLDDKTMMQQLLADAMGLWNDVPGSYVKLTFAAGETADDPDDRKFCILTKKSSSLSSAAYATPRFDEDNPRLISDCDVHINDSAVDAGDLAFTIAHELGHCLGLGHSHTNYGAIMGYSRGTRSLTLGADDRAGLIYLYPDPAVWDGKKKELVCGSIGASPATRATWRVVLTMLVLPVLAAAAAEVRTRRRRET